jgi:hypothetical protein
VPAAHRTTYEPCLPRAHHRNGVAEYMIETITKNALSMIVDSRAPLLGWREAVNPGVDLAQQTPQEGLTKGDDCNGYPAPYPTPYHMLQAFVKPTHDIDCNEIAYKALLDHIQRFGCFSTRLIPEPQRHGIFTPRSWPCMIVRNRHD